MSKSSAFFSSGIAYAFSAGVVTMLGIERDDKAMFIVSGALIIGAAIFIWGAYTEHRRVK